MSASASANTVARYDDDDDDDDGDDDDDDDADGPSNRGIPFFETTLGIVVYLGGAAGSWLPTLWQPRLLGERLKITYGPKRSKTMEYKKSLHFPGPLVQT